MIMNTNDKKLEEKNQSFLFFDIKDLYFLKKVNSSCYFHLFFM
jgi:hypothetical protein